MGYVLEENILRPAEISILQRRGLHNKFLNSKARTELSEGGIESYLDETDHAYFRSLRDQLFGIEEIDNTLVYEEMQIQTALENAWEGGGRVASEAASRGCAPRRRDAPGARGDVSRGRKRGGRGE